MDLALEMKLWGLEIEDISVGADNYFNAKQCINLLGNLQRALQEVQVIIGSNQHIFQPLLEDLSRIVLKAMMLVKSCSGDWREVALMQRKTKETYRELLMELKWINDMIFEVGLKKRLCEEIDLTRVNQFDPCDWDEVESDENQLYAILEEELSRVSLSSKEHDLIKYIRLWQNCIRNFEKGATKKINFPNLHIRDFETLPEPLTSGTYLYISTWLGLCTVTKVIKYDYVDPHVDVEKEASILSQLNHPNIIRIFYSYFHTNDMGKIILIGMEKGDIVLTKILFKEKTLKLSLLKKIDIIVQIAKAMYYLHNMMIAHRDLKPDNIVVVDYEKTKKRSGYFHVKLIDFGISKFEVNGLEIPTRGEPYGTSGYIAPEAKQVSKTSLQKVDAFKVDVFSFGMVCYDILVQEEDKSTEDNISKRIQYKIQRLEKFSCPLEFRLMIKDCLFENDPSRRPSFKDILKRLMDIKKIALEDQLNVGLSQSNHGLWNCVHFLHMILPISFASLWRMTTKIQKNTNNSRSINFHSNIDNTFPNHQNAISLQSRISELEKALVKNSMVGVVGIAGIGKTTLVNAFKEYYQEKILKQKNSLPIANYHTKKKIFW